MATAPDSSRDPDTGGEAASDPAHPADAIYADGPDTAALRTAFTRRTPHLALVCVRSCI